MNIGIDMRSEPAFTRIVLVCTCGTVEDFESDMGAYTAGWRLVRQRVADAPYKAVCPECMAKRDRAWRRKAVDQYGAEAVDRADRIMREKHR